MPGGLAQINLANIALVHFAFNRKPRMVRQKRHHQRRCRPQHQNRTHRIANLHKRDNPIPIPAEMPIVVYPSCSFPKLLQISGSCAMPCAWQSSPARPATAPWNVLLVQRHLVFFAHRERGSGNHALSTMTWARTYARSKAARPDPPRRPSPLQIGACAIQAGRRKASKLRPRLG